MMDPLIYCLKYKAIFYILRYNKNEFIILIIVNHKLQLNLNYVRNACHYT